MQLLLAAITQSATALSIKCRVFVFLMCLRLTALDHTYFFLKRRSDNRDCLQKALDWACGFLKGLVVSNFSCLQRAVSAHILAPDLLLREVWCGSPSSFPYYALHDFKRRILHRIHRPKTSPRLLMPVECLYKRGGIWLRIGSCVIEFACGG